MNADVEQSAEIKENDVSAVVDAEFSILFSGPFLGGDLALVSADPELRKIGWSLKYPSTTHFNGTIAISQDAGETIETKILACKEYVRQALLEHEMAKKFRAIVNGQRLQ